MRSHAFDFIKTNKRLEREHKFKDGEPAAEDFLRPLFFLERPSYSYAGLWSKLIGHGGGRVSVVVVGLLGGFKGTPCCCY